MIRRHVMGIFNDEDRTIDAIKALKESAFPIKKVHSPIPSHKLMDAMGVRKSLLGYFTLMGGIAGFFIGFFLAMYTSVQWNLIVSGKPIVALVPFFIVGFECTILFGVLGNVIGLLTLSRLPRYKNLQQYDERLSGNHFGIVAECEEGQQENLTRFFEEKGAETKRVYIY